MSDSRDSMAVLPALICGYSRSVEFKNLLNSLVRYGCKKIYVNIDGGIDEHTRIEQLSMKKFIVKIRMSSPDVLILARQSRTNLGAAVSIISSLDWFFSKEEVGLILEDDLELDPGIFRFSDWALSYYEPDPEIWIIAGSNFFSDNPNLRGKLHMPNYPVTWGWATWAKKWPSIREGILGKPEPPRRLKFNKISNFWSVGSKRARHGLVDAWDIPLAEVMQRTGAKSVVPPFNFIRNIGFSSFASNTHELRFPLNRAFDSGINQLKTNVPFELSLLHVAEINTLYENQIYGIRRHHSLSTLFSIFDSLRFRKKIRGSLARRLEQINAECFDDI